LNGSAYTANSTGTGLEPVYGGSLSVGSNGTDGYLEGDVTMLAAGKTYQPTVATIVSQFVTDTPDLSLFPSSTSIFWNAVNDTFSYTGSDIAITFPLAYSTTTSRNEFTIVPQVADLDQKERRAITRLVDKLRPVDTILTIKPGNHLRNELPILDVSSTSNRFTVLREVTGNANVNWPAIDVSEGYWIDYTTREAPTFAFLDRQEAATYISVYNVEASSTHIGQFNQFQRSLFSHLANLNDLLEFKPNNCYAKAIAPLNIVKPWVKRDSQEKLLINGYYPIGYFTSENTNISIAQNTQEFWASVEKYAPESDSLIIDLDVVRPVNFLDFNIAQKPIDITLEWNDNGTWKPVEIKEGYEAEYKVSYLPSALNPWAYLEYNFDIIQTDKFRLTFTRREDIFPDGNQTDNPWSIEVQNLRVIHLIQAVTDYVVDNGTDILGNVFSTELLEYEAANVIDPEEEGNWSYWQSQPNPSRDAVEALYFDLRDASVDYTMATLNGLQMDVLDDRSMTDLTDYYSATVLIDEVYIKPVSHGPQMHFYYSTDDTPDWDSKLWIPIPQNYTLRHGIFALPAPTAVKYFKIEFTNLTPIPYQFIEYPKNITTKFRRYPTWVQNYFTDLFPTKPYEENLQMEETIKLDPLKYGYQNYLDALSTGYKEVRSELFKDTTLELRQYIDDVIGGREQRLDQLEVEKQIKFFSPVMWQQNLIALLDPTRAATRRMQFSPDNEWSAELTRPVFIPPTQKSQSSLAEVAADKMKPMMWFPRAVRHGYQLIEARFNNKVAYQVAISEVKFLRRDLSIKHDEEIYFETLEDEAHITSNNLVRLDTYRWGAS
jgi:acetolactate synthase small subunit